MSRVVGPLADGREPHLCDIVCARLLLDDSWRHRILLSGIFELEVSKVESEVGVVVAEDMVLTEGSALEPLKLASA